MIIDQIEIRFDIVDDVWFGAFCLLTFLGPLSFCLFQQAVRSQAAVAAAAARQELH